MITDSSSCKIWKNSTVIISHTWSIVNLSLSWPLAPESKPDPLVNSILEMNQFVVEMPQYTYNHDIPNIWTLRVCDFLEMRAGPLLSVVRAHTTFHTYPYFSQRIITTTLTTHIRICIHHILALSRMTKHSKTGRLHLYSLIVILPTPTNAS